MKNTSMKKMYLTWSILLPLFLFTLAIHAQWSEPGAGTSPLNADNTIYAVHVTSAGMVLAGGAFRNDSSHTYVAAWSNGTWKELGGDNSLQGDNTIYTIASDTAGNMYAAGMMTEGGQYVIGHFNAGSGWSLLGNVGFNGYIRSLVTDASGNLYAAGSFKNDSNQYYVAKWDGSSFSELGTGVNALKPNGEIKCLTTDQAGNVYAAGFFTSGGKYYVAKWNGSSWEEAGTLNADNYINDIVTDANGHLFAAGGFTAPNNISYIAKWNGSTWNAPGNLSTNNYIFDLAADASGNVYAAGSFTNNSNKPYVAKWDGNTWNEVGAPTGLNPNDDILSVAIAPSGNVYGAGYFTNAGNYNYVAEFTPTVSNISQANSDFKVSVYPNPFANQLTLQALQLPATDMQVYDVAGRKIYEGKTTSCNYTLITTDWNLGVYWLKISSPDNSSSQTIRLIKSN